MVTRRADGASLNSKDRPAGKRWVCERNTTPSGVPEARYRIFGFRWLVQICVAMRGAVASVVRACVAGRGWEARVRDAVRGTAAFRPSGAGVWVWDRWMAVDRPG